MQVRSDKDAAPCLKPELKQDAMAKSEGALIALRVRGLVSALHQGVVQASKHFAGFCLWLACVRTAIYFVFEKHYEFWEGLACFVWDFSARVDRGTHVLGSSMFQANLGQGNCFCKAPHIYVETGRC